MPENIDSFLKDIEYTSKYQNKNFSLEHDPSKYDDSFVVPEYGNRQDALQENRAQEQTTLDKWGNSAINFGVLAGTTFADGIIGTVMGAINAAETINTNKDSWNAFISNPFSEAMVEAQETFRADYPVYYTQAQSNQDWYEAIVPFSGGATNFWADKVFKNLGFAVGAIGSAMLTGNATSSLLNNAKTASKFAEGLIALGEDGKNYIQLAKEGSDVAKEVADAAKLLKNKNLATQVIGSLAGAQGEARFEGINAMKEFEKNSHDKLTSELLASNPLLNLQQAQEQATEILANDKDFQQNRIDVGNQVFGANVALLTATGAMEYGKFLTKGYNPSKYLVNDIALNLEKGLAIEAGNRFTKSGLYKGAKAASKNFIAEGPIEEMGQAVISKSFKDYHTRKYDNKTNDDAINYLTDFNNALSETYGTAKGWEEGVIGGLSGIGMSAATGEFKQSKQQSENTKKTIEALNELMQKPNFKTGFDNLKTKLSIEKDKLQSLNEGNLFDYKNAENAEFTHAVNTFIDAGKFDDFINYLEAGNKATPEEIKDLVSKVVTNSDGTQVKQSPFDNFSNPEIKTKVLENVSKLTTQAKKIRDLRNNIEIRFPGLKNDFKKDLVHQASTIDNVDTRIKQIQTKFASKGIALDLNSFVNTDYVQNITQELNDKIKSDPAQNLELIEDWEDLNKLLSARVELNKKYLDALTNPEVLEKEAFKAKKQADKEKKEEERQNTQQYSNPVEVVSDFENDQDLTESEFSEYTDAELEEILNNPSVLPGEEELKELVRQELTNRKKQAVINVTTAEELDQVVEQLKNKKLEREREAEIELLKQRLARQKELENAFNNIPFISEISPFTKVKYKNKVGYIIQDEVEDILQFREEGTNNYTDIPKLENEETYSGKLYDYNIFELEKENPIVDEIEIKEVGNKLSITINGKTYYNNYSNPLMAINRDKEGYIISVDLETKDGKKRTFKKYADELAYNILLHTINKLENESSGTGEEFKSRVTEETSKQDSKTKESNITQADSEESRKIELAIENLEEGIKESQRIIREELEQIIEAENQKLEQLILEEQELIEKKKAELEKQKTAEIINTELNQEPTILEDQSNQSQFSEDSTIADQDKVTSGNKINYATRDVVRSEQENKIVTTAVDAVNEGHHSENAKPNELAPGTKLTLKAGTKAVQTYNYQNGQAVLVNGLKEVVMLQPKDFTLENMPIEIYEGTKLVGYYPTVDWIKENHKSQKFNVAEGEYEAILQQVIDFRTSVWNNRQSEFETTVTDKKTGKLFLTKEYLPFIMQQANYVSDNYKNNIQSFHIADGNLFSDLDVINKPENEYNKGTVVQVIPMANGTKLAYPVLVPTLDEGYVDSMMSFIEAFYSGAIDPDQARQMIGIFNADVTINPKVFLEQFIFSQTENPTKANQYRIKLRGGERKLEITLMTADEKPKVISDINTFAANREALKNHLLNNLYSIKKAKLAKVTTKFNLVTFDNRGLVVTPFESYNHFVTSIVKTSAKSYTLKDGSTIYAGQPVINFSTPKIKEVKPAATQTTTTTPTTPVSTDVETGISNLFTLNNQSAVENKEDIIANSSKYEFTKQIENVTVEQIIDVTKKSVTITQRVISNDKSIYFDNQIYISPQGEVSSRVSRGGGLSFFKDKSGVVDEEAKLKMVKLAETIKNYFPEIFAKIEDYAKKYKGFVISNKKFNETVKTVEFIDAFDSFLYDKELLSDADFIKITLHNSKLTTLEPAVEKPKVILPVKEDNQVKKRLQRNPAKKNTSSKSIIPEQRQALENSPSIEALTLRNVDGSIMDFTKQKRIVNLLVNFSSQYFVEGNTDVDQIFNAFFDDMEDLANVANNEENYTEELEFRNIVNQFEKISEFAKIELGKFGLSFKTKTVTAKEDNEDGFDVVKGERYEVDNVSKDPRNNVSWQVKLMLNNIYDLDNEETFMGYIETVPFEQVYTKLKHILKDINFKSFNDIVKYLTDNHKDDKIVAQVLDKIQGIERTTDDEGNEVVEKTYFPIEYQNMFYTAMVSRGVAMQIINYVKEKGATALSKVSIFFSDRNSATQTLLNEWNNKAKIGSLVQEINGEKFLNKDKIKEFKEKADAIKDLGAKVTTDPVERANAIEFIKEFFTALNIDPTLADKIIDIEIQKRHFKKGLTKNGVRGLFDGKNGLIYNIINSLNNVVKDTKEEYNWELANPFIKEGSDRGISILAKIAISEGAQVAAATSAKNINKDTYWNFANNSHLDWTLNKLKEAVNLDNYRKIPALLNNYWLKPGFVQNISKSDLDGLNQSNTTKDGVQRPNMTLAEQLLVVVNGFTAKLGNNYNQMVFVSPTLSDKSNANALFLVDKLDAPAIILNGKEFTFSETALDELKNIAISEFTRIQAFKKAKNAFIKKSGKSFNEAEEDFKALVGDRHYDGASKFLLFPQFEELLKGVEEEKHGTIFNDNLNTVVNTVFTTMIKDFQKMLIDSNLITTQFAYINKGYIDHIKSNFKFANNDEIALYIAGDIVTNYALNYSGYMGLIGGDISQFYKKNKENNTIKGNSISTYIEYNKRGAKDVAPGTDGSWIYTLPDGSTLDNSTQLKVYAKDFKVPPFGEYLQKQFGVDSFEITDAQEYTTLLEHINRMFAFEDLSYNDYVTLRNKIVSGETITKDDLNIVLQPFKLVYVNGHLENVEGYEFIKMTYDKTSSFPLIAELTKDTELDKVRIALEEADRLNGHKGVSLVYASGSKAGTVNPVTIWNNDGTVKNNLTEQVVNKVNHQSREGLRKQQHNPLKKSTEIKVVSQMDKLIHDGTLNMNFVLNGVNKTGKELRELKEGIRIEQYQRAATNLLKELGATEKDGIFRFEDLNKLIEVLKKEDREGKFSINDYAALTLEDGALKYPLSLLNKASEFELFLNSIITNRIINTKITGTSKIQGTSAGFKFLEDVEDRSGIIYTGTYDADGNFIRKYNGNKLNHLHKNEAGEVKVAQIFVPWKFKGLNMEDYLTPDGKHIDPDKLPEKLLQLIGARIPNQGHNSQLPIEIAGFLPESFGDLMLVPYEIAKQMGSDFDVDKLYAYLNKHFVNEGIVEILTPNPNTPLENMSNEELEQLYKDIHWSILTDPQMTDKIVSSLDKDDLKIEITKAPSEKELILESPLYIGKHLLEYESQKDAKELVGLFSLGVTHNVITQGHNLFLLEEVVVEGKKRRIRKSINWFQGYNLSNLSGYGISTYNGEERTTTENLKIGQNAVLDNAKEKIAGILNLNKITYGVWNLLSRLSENTNNVAIDKQKALSLDYVARFINQPIINEYVQLVKNKQSSLNPNFTKTPQKDAIYELTTKYSEGLSDQELTVIEKTKFNLDNLQANLKKSNSKDHILFQLAVLKAYEELDAHAEDWNKIQTVITSDVNGATEDIITASAQIDKINRLQYSNSIANGVSLLGSFTEDGDLLPETQFGWAAKLGPILSAKLWAKFYPYNRSEYKNLEKRIEEITNKEDVISTEFRKIVWNNFKSFLFSSNNLGLFKDVNQERKRLLVDEFTSDREYTPEDITTLKPNEVFVFGANTAGGHGGGTAGLAQRGSAISNYEALPVGTKGKWSEYGVVDRLMEGTEGKSFGIVTKSASIENGKLTIGSKRSVPLNRIEASINALIESAKQNPNLKYLVTKFGTNMAGFSIQEMKTLLENKDLPDNIILPKEFEVRSSTKFYTNKSLATRALELKERVNNLILQSLSSELATKNDDFSLVKFNVGGAKVDGDEYTKAFYDLLLSNDEEISTFAQDLITYQYITAGTQNAINIIKYIPIEYLNTIPEFSRHINYVFNNLTQPNFIRQFIQSNPRYAYQLKGELKTVLTPIDVLAKDKYPALLNITDNSGELNLGDKYIPYFAIYDSELKKSFLYEYVAGQYKLIPTLGTNKIGASEYQFENENAISLINKVKESNLTEPVIQQPNELEKTVETPVVTKTIEEEFFDQLELKNGNKATIINSLNIIANSDSTYVPVAKLYLALQDLIPENIKLKIENTNKYRGQVDGTGTIVTLSPLGEKKSSENLNRITKLKHIEETFLHEINHLVQLSTFNKFIKVGEGDAFESFINGNKELKTAMYKLNSLLKYAREYFKNNPVSPEDKWAVDYALSDIKEFTSMIYNPQVASLFAKIPSNQPNKSILDRLKSLVVDLIKSIGNKIGFDIKGSLLEDILETNFRINEELLKNKTDNENISLIYENTEPIVKEVSNTNNKYELFPGVYANKEQTVALDKLNNFLNSDKKEFVLIGKGGTGKTTIIKNIVNQEKNKGKTVLGITVAHQAKKILGKSIGKEITSTLASALAIKLDETTGKFVPDEFARKANNVPIKFADLVILDETSMVSKELLDEIREWLKPTAKIIYMGDNGQLPPIGEGVLESPTFHANKTENEKAELLQRMRQTDESPILPLSDQVYLSNETRAIKTRVTKIDDKGNGVIFSNDEAKFLQQAAEDFKKDPTNTKIVTFNNERNNNPQSVKTLNLKIRSLLWGKDSANQFNIGELVTAYDTYTKDDELKPLMFNSDSFKVINIVEEKNVSGAASAYSKKAGFRQFNYVYDLLHLTLQDVDGEIINVPVIANSSEEKYQQDLSKLWNSDKQLAFKLSGKFANLQYGYAVTSHKAQGSEYNNVYGLEDNVINGSPADNLTKNKSLYVIITRAKKKLNLLSVLNTNQTIEPINNVLKEDLSGDVIDTLNTIPDKKPQPVLVKTDLVSRFKKEVGLNKKTVSNQQQININLKVKKFNGLNGTSFYVKFTPFAQTTDYTWEIQNKAIAKDDNQLDMFASKSIIPNIVKPGVQELFNENPELASIGTQQQYSQYLDTIFPNSKVKDIVYHGTNVQFDKFDKKFINKSFENLFYFYKNINNALNWKGETSYFVNKLSLIEDINSLRTSMEEANIEDNLLYALTQHFKVNNINELSNVISKYELEKINNFLLATKLNNIDLYSLYKNNIENYRQVVRNNINNLPKQIKIDNNKVIFAIINSKNPLILNEKYDYYLGTQSGQKLRRDINNNISNYDSLVAKNVTEYENDEIKNKDTQYGVKEPEQIHILGNKQDIKGFKEFVNKPSKSIVPIKQSIASKDFLLSLQPKIEEIKKYC